MSAHIPIHETITYRLGSIEGGGWEFVCPECGYRARYTQATQSMVILNPGDEKARHTSHQIQVLPRAKRKILVVSPDVQEMNSEATLPLELVKRIEAILAKHQW